LKECPFCGEAGRLLGPSENGTYMISCENRDCTVNPFTDVSLDKEEVVLWWNRRAPLPVIKYRNIRMEWLNGQTKKYWLRYARNMTKSRMTKEQVEEWFNEALTEGLLYKEDIQ
jgi:hypothetical protein